jgi:transcriptional regulator with XRE-family HTH domain
MVRLNGPAARDEYNSSMARNVSPRFKSERRRTFFREWRKYRGYTLEQAAEIASMTAGNISAMERGAQGYTQDGLEALAHAYRCDPGQLLNVDPNSSDIWSIWEVAKASDRQKIIEIAKTITGKTGTGG